MNALTILSWENCLFEVSVFFRATLVVAVNKALPRDYRNRSPEAFRSLNVSSIQKTENEEEENHEVSG